MWCAAWSVSIGSSEPLPCPGEMRFEKRAADLIKRLFVLLVTAPPQDARGLQCDTCSPLGNRKGWEPFLVALKWLC